MGSFAMCDGSLETARDTHRLHCGRVESRRINLVQVGLVSVQLIVAPGFLLRLLRAQVLDVGGSSSRGHITDVLHVLVTRLVLELFKMHALLVIQPDQIETQRW